MMARKYARIVGQIERCFRVLYEERNLEELSITHIEAWMNDNTKGGMSKMRLVNFLNKRPQFRLIRRERKVGTTRVESFWALDDLVYEVPNTTEARKGWRLEYPKTDEIEGSW